MYAMSLGGYKGLGVAVNVIQRERRCGSDSDTAPWVTAYSRT